MKKKSQLLLSLISLSTLQATAIAQDKLESEEQELEHIIVHGALSSTPLSKMATSIAVIDEQAIQARQAQHLEDLLNRAANVNFASGASRGRFIQIRGIGERSQFTDPINPSVGFLVDGINYSGLLAGASTFDIAQVEIFKGPNSARFGADGLAGMINFVSHEASEQSSFDAQLGAANYGSWHLGAATGGALTDTTQYRVSVHQNTSDGFVKNTYLNQEDTNGIDELTLRGKLNWQVNNDLSIKTVLHLIDVDNGYDAFSLNRDRTTLSDQPGTDAQKSEALGLSFNYAGIDWADLQIHSSFMQADLAYGYDEDWSYVGIAPGWEYSSTDYYFRDRNDKSLQAKLTSKEQNNNWVLGMYFADNNEDLNREYTWLSSPFTSNVSRKDSAVFAQYKHNMSDSQWLTTSLRLASQRLNYQDSNLIAQDLKHTDWGAEVSYQQQVSNESMLYVSLLRSYKMGGVNGQALGKIDDQDIVEFRLLLLDNASFKPESLLGIEFGIKGANQARTLEIDFTTFYQKRNDVQYKNSIVNEQSFVDFYNNAASGKNYGIEVSLDYQLSDTTQLFANLGYLKTEIHGITRQSGETIDKRAQAHAPEYQLNAGVNWQISNKLSWLLELDAKDEYYYSFSHDQVSQGFVIAHSSLGYQEDNWRVSLYVRNLFDKTYANRGFYFGNDPRDEYTTHLYEQFAEPRRVGVNFSFHY
ncbi:TonB-dependent receptor [Paraglaciecola aestuariivivens]